MALQLTGQQSSALVNALGKAFNPATLNMMLQHRLSKIYANYDFGYGFEYTIFNLVQASQMEGWTEKLIAASRGANPGNPHLMAFEELLGLSASNGLDRNNLEKIVREKSKFVNIVQFRTRLGRLEDWICAIESPGGPGTGFLVGSDLVLTNYHVIAPQLLGEVAQQAVRCRFDYKALPGNGIVVNQGSSFSLAPEWDVAHSKYANFDLSNEPPDPNADELDYALIRLASSPGSEPIGPISASAGVEPGAKTRGWLTLASTARQMAATEDLFILQHPQDLDAKPVIKLLPMQLAFGEVMGFAGGGRRLRHDTKTLPGSSGSPCLDADLELVALHHAGDPKSRLAYKGEFNQAIPIGLIIEDLQAKGISGLIDEEPS